MFKKPGTFAAPYHSSTVTWKGKTFVNADFLAITDTGFWPKLVISKKSLTVVGDNASSSAPTLVKKSDVDGNQNLSLL